MMPVTFPRFGLSIIRNIPLRYTPKEQKSLSGLIPINQNRSTSKSNQNPVAQLTFSQLQAIIKRLIKSPTVTVQLQTNLQTHKKTFRYKNSKVIINKNPIAHTAKIIIQSDNLEEERDMTVALKDNIERKLGHSSRIHVDYDPIITSTQIALDSAAHARIEDGDPEG